MAENDFRRILPRFTPAAMVANMALVELLKSIATRHNASPAQTALAWLLTQQPWLAPISGTTKLHRLEENLGSVNLRLTPADLAEIETASAQIQIEGERYPAHLISTTGH